ELVASKPEVILAQNALEAKAVLEQTHTLPIVFATCADPVEEGLVGSFSRPGGQCHWFLRLRARIGRQVDRATQGDCARCDPSGGRRNTRGPGGATPGVSRHPRRPRVLLGGCGPLS